MIFRAPTISLPIFHLEYTWSVTTPIFSTTYDPARSTSKLLTYIKEHFVAWSCFFVSEFLEKFNNFSWKRNIRWDRFNANQFDLMRIMRHCIVQHALCLWGWDHSLQRKWERREVTPPWIWVLCVESISEVTKRISYRSYRVQISWALYV